MTSKEGGGTDPKPFFNYCTQNGHNVHCAVCLTDMGFDYNIPTPSYPVIWVSTTKGADSPKFGSMITIPVE